MRILATRRAGVALLLALGAGALVAPARAGPTFRVLTHVLKAPGRVLDVGYGDFDGDGRQDIVAAHVMDDGSTKDARGVAMRYVSVWRQEGARFSSAPVATRNVPDDAVAFAVGDFDPAKGDEVAFLGPRGVCLLKGRAETVLADLAPIASLQGFYDYPVVMGLPRWDLSPDLGSGRPDLLVPTKDGYGLLRHDGAAAIRPAGTLKVPSGERFGPAFETKFLNRFLTYISTMPKVVAIDLDGDKRKDLVVYRKKGLARFLQKADGTFPQAPDNEKPLTIVEDAAKRSKKKELADGKGGGEGFQNVRLSLVDLDSDGFADLVATKTIGEVGVFETLRTQLLVWRGGAGGWNEAKPDRILNQKGVTTDPLFVDWDGDGRRDLVLSSLRVDHFTNLKRAITKSITITYAIYLQGKGGFPEEPEFSRDVTVDLDALESRTGARLALFEADLNGDRFRDMILRSARGKLRVVPGGVEEGFFSGKTLAFKEDDAVDVDVPPNADIEVRDLRRDGKGDALVLMNPAAEDPERASVRIVEVAR